MGGNRSRRCVAPEPMIELRGCAMVGTDAAIASFGGRYVVERALGEGGMGSVYLVRERDTGERLAIKELRRVDAQGIARFKREFRSLAGLYHGNLIRLYDLECVDGRWFFTMEHVDGPDLLTYILGHGPAHAESQSQEKCDPDATAVRRVDPEVEGEVRWGRLGRTFLQVARAVQALHAAGKLHLDLKPSNVLVEDGRAVVLDFGLVREIRDVSGPVPRVANWAGTPHYMAPEQAAGGTLSQATDWYAFGAVLYEAMTDRLPFDGTVDVIMKRKCYEDPPYPCQIRPSTPQELSDLCMRLLSRDPSQRPDAHGVIACLEALRVAAVDSLPVVEAGEGAFNRVDAPAFGRLIGRDRDLAVLHRVAAEAFTGKTAVVEVCGSSGAGKTELVSTFLTQLVHESGRTGDACPWVFRGRCHEREALPFKALDGVLEELASRLEGLDEAVANELLCEDVEVLSRLSPAIARLPCVAARYDGDVPWSGLGEGARSRAQVAVRELVARVAARNPLVIWIDDLQWGDQDSSALLADWLERPLAVPLLLVLGYRSDEAESSPCLRRLLTDEAGHVAVPTRHRVTLGPLGSEQAESLSRERLGSDADRCPALVSRIAVEAHGNPFLITQLAALAQAKLRRGDADASTISLSALVSNMAELLSREAKTLVAMLALAGRPMPLHLAGCAARIDKGVSAPLHTLRLLGLVRTRDWATHRLVEISHDAVRAVVLGLLSERRRRQGHRSWLSTLERAGITDPDWLHMHARGARLREPSLRYGMAAAERAMDAFAFERGASLYREMLGLLGPHSDEAQDVLIKLAVAQASAGHGQAAAQTYRIAAERAGDQASALRHTRLAASHLQRSGDFARGRKLTGEVLDAMGARVPKTTAGLVGSLALEGLRMSFRGHGFVRRPASALSADRLEQLDTYLALQVDTTLVDPLRAALFQARQLRLALAAGEPERVLLAMCGELLSVSITATPRAERRAERIRGRMEALTVEVDTPLSRAFVRASVAVSHFMFGRYQEVIEPSYEAERLMLGLGADRGEGNYFTRLAAAAARMAAFAPLGRFRVMRQESAEILREARGTDNHCAVLQLALVETLAEDCLGHLDASVERLAGQSSQLPDGPFSMLHLIHMVARLWALCGTGDMDAGLALLERWWPRYRRAAVRRVASLRTIAEATRLRLLISASQRQGRSPARGLVREARALARLPAPMAAGYGMRALSRLAFLEGNRERALGHLRASSASFAAADARFEEARNQVAEGQLVDRTGVPREVALDRLREAGHERPDLAVASHFPELL